MSESKAVLNLEPGQTAIFGYGSLLSRASMELTLGRSYSGPLAMCSLAGWRRTWDVFMPNTSFYEISTPTDFIPSNIIYLNVRQRPGEPVNGVVYVLGPEELDAFDRREWIYDRTVVSADLLGLDVRGGEVYTYVGKQQWLLHAACPREHAAVRKTYLKLVDNGLEELGPAFRACFEASTDILSPDRIFADQKKSGSHPLLAEATPKAG